eukprot:c22516_g1_i2 orf=306-1361(-)
MSHAARMERSCAKRNTGPALPSPSCFGCLVRAPQKGPVLYTFSVPPVLSCRSLWSENHTMLLEPDNHQEYMVRVNKGSKLHVSCMMQSAGFYSILLTISQGYSRRRKWFGSRTVRHAVEAWREVHSQVGDLEYEAMQDGNYFISVRNLNQQPVAIELQLEVNATIYSTESADTECFLGPKSCVVSLPTVGKRYTLLTTGASENGTLTWEVDLSYGARWISYYSILAGVLLLVSALLKTMSRFSQSLQEQAMPQDAVVDEGMRSSLLSLKDGETDAGLDANLDFQGMDNQLSKNMPDAYLCAICLDAPKTVFFIPCGHAATCLACAKRIRQHDVGCCPLCRVKIEKIGNIFG